MISINNEFNREDKQMKLFKLYRLMLALMLAAVLSGCAISKIEARHTYDSQMNFSGLNSYAWVQGNHAGFTTSESAEHYKSAMENMLATKGFNLNPGAPDFLIITYPVNTYVEKYTNYNGNVEFPKAMLRINFLNPSSKEVIYESAATAYVDENATQESKNATIDKAVKGLLSEFPPGR
jgi:hypothetical protein